MSVGSVSADTTLISHDFESGWPSPPCTAVGWAVGAYDGSQATFRDTGDFATVSCHDVISGTAGEEWVLEAKLHRTTTGAVRVIVRGPDDIEHFRIQWSSGGGNAVYTNTHTLTQTGLYDIQYQMTAENGGYIDDMSVVRIDANTPTPTPTNTPTNTPDATATFTPTPSGPTNTPVPTFTPFPTNPLEPLV